MMNIIKTFLNAKHGLQNEKKDLNKLNFFNELKDILNFHVFSSKRQNKYS